MSSPDLHDAWSAGRSYDHYMGRWSRGIASQFTRWLDLPDGLDWLDIGCGTGALTSAEETKDGGIQAKVTVTIEIENQDRPACVIETISRFYPE